MLCPFDADAVANAAPAAAAAGDDDGDDDADILGSQWLASFDTLMLYETNTGEASVSSV